MIKTAKSNIKKRNYTGSIYAMKMQSFLAKKDTLTPIEQITLAVTFGIICSFILMFWVNYSFYNFPGITYIPGDFMAKLGLIILLLNIGCHLSLTADHWLSQLLIRFTKVFLLLCIIASFTNAVQLTPFTPIDSWLLQIDQALGVNMTRLLSFTYSSTLFTQVLKFVYLHLDTELTLTMIAIVIFKHQPSENRFFFLILLSALIGFDFYYFFPTTAPASMVDSPYFTYSQRYTGIKFDLIHQYKLANSIEGGLIAMPSYHCLWALICQYYWYCRFPKAAHLLLPFNGLILVSCVMLGWHYLVDVLASMVIFCTSYILMKRLTN